MTPAQGYHRSRQQETLAVWYDAEREDTYEAQHTLPSTMHPEPQGSSLVRQLD